MFLIRAERLKKQKAQIIFEPEYRRPEAFRGIEEYDYICKHVVEKSMGENMTDKMKLLDELMNNALQIPKFRRYNEAYQKIDSEMTRILTDEEEFDSNILKLKQEIDKFLNQ